MSVYGGTRYGRDARRANRRRRFQLLGYVGLTMLAVVTAAVVVLALQK